MKRAAIAVAMLVVGAVAVATALPGGVSKDQQVGDQAAAFVLAQAPGAAAAPSAAAKPLPDNPGFYEGEAGLTPSEIAGREIWYKATGGNARFHTYVFQQRSGILVDWFRVLRTDQRDDRFASYGLINDPGCCTPGADGCPAKSPDETYGFDWCPGDQELLKFVGSDRLSRPGVRFPRCPAAGGPSAPRQEGPAAVRPAISRSGPPPAPSATASSPIPRFDRERWVKLNGRAGSWEGFSKTLSADKADSDYGVRRLADGSIEPPFLVGTSCGSCHIAFDPLNPPSDPARPEWQNIKGGIGNQYLRISELLGSGMPYDSIEYQMFSHARPGTSDTSAIPNDQVSNPGTINALINLPQRPVFAGEDVIKWRTATACPATPAAGDEVLVRAGARRQVLDSVARRGEATRTPHPEGRRGLDRGARGDPAGVLQYRFLLRAMLAQPPDRSAPARPRGAQLRPDALRHRAVPARLSQLPGDRGPAGRISRRSCSRRRTTRPTCTLRAKRRCRRKNPSRRATATTTWSRTSTRQFGKGAVARGRVVFAEKCATLPFQRAGVGGRRFRQSRLQGARPEDRAPPRLARQRPGDAGERGRNLPLPGAALQPHGGPRLAGVRLGDAARAQAGSATSRRKRDGGRGYYRNISLLSLWAHAPFMHNNAIGPGDLRQAAERGQLLLSLALRRPQHEGAPAGRHRAGVLALRPQRRRPLQALRRLDDGPAQPGRSACPRSPSSTSPVPLRARLAARSRGRQAEAGRRPHRRRAEGRELRRPRQFPAQDVRARPGDVEAQGRRAGPDARQDPSVPTRRRKSSPICAVSAWSC